MINFFDEEAYLRENLDVRILIDRDEVNNVSEHLLAEGLEEIVKIMKLPFIPCGKVSQINKIEEIIPSIDYSPITYNTNRSKLAKLFYNIYDTHGINIHFGLKNIAQDTNILSDLNG